MLDVIGVVDNVEEKVHSKNVVFDLKDLRLVSLCMLFYIYSSVLISLLLFCNVVLLSH